MRTKRIITGWNSGRCRMSTTPLRLTIRSILNNFVNRINLTNFSCSVDPDSRVRQTWMYDVGSDATVSKTIHLPSRGSTTYRYAMQRRSRTSSPVTSSQ